MRKEVSRDPWFRVKGRREELDLGVLMPVWGPVPVPYMVGGGRVSIGDEYWPEVVSIRSTAIVEVYSHLCFDAALGGSVSKGNVA
jgi:hypothetical protein